MDWRLDLAALGACLDDLRAINERFGSMETAAITIEEIEAFESQHHVTLAESHRAWLLALGRQPIVPGLVGGRALDLDACTEDQIYQTFCGPLDSPFAYTGQQPIALEWDDGLDDYVDQTPLRGTMCLGSSGCDEIWVVVVSGPESGMVWGFVPGLDEALQPTGLTVPAWNLQRVEARLQEEREWLRRRGA